MSLEKLTSENSVYSKMIDLYLPSKGQGDNLASQLVTAANKLIYKWWNDGDQVMGQVNNLTDQANWIENYFPQTEKLFDEVKWEIKDDLYEKNFLVPLIQFVFREDFLKDLSSKSKKGDIYNCDGRFIFDDDEY